MSQPDRLLTTDGPTHTTCLKWDELSFKFKVRVYGTRSLPRFVIYHHSRALRGNTANIYWMGKCSHPNSTHLCRLMNAIEQPKKILDEIALTKTCKIV